jgi:hypothetical protein
VAAGPSEAEQRRATAWAAKRADIVVWCSTSFLPREQLLWEALPDHTKDNGFLLLTKSDLLGGRDAVAGIVKRVEMRAGEEFRRVLPLSVLQAGRAVLADGGLDREIFRDSGASAVISAIKTRVELARRADADTAEALLLRHASAPKRMPRRGVDPVPVLTTGPVAMPEALPEPPPPTATLAPVVSELRPPPRRVLSAPPDFTPPVYQPPSAPKQTLERPVAVAAPPASAPAPTELRPGSRPPRQTPLLLVPKGDGDPIRPRPRVTARPAAAAAPPLREMLSPADTALVEAALARITAAADEMTESVASATSVPVEDILDLSHAVTDDIAGILAKASARQVRRIAADLGEIQDLVLLMKLEKGPAPADDAITLLLQIRRELETVRAA